MKPKEVGTTFRCECGNVVGRKVEGKTSDIFKKQNYCSECGEKMDWNEGVCCDGTESDTKPIKTNGFEAEEVARAMNSFAAALRKDRLEKLYGIKAKSDEEIKEEVLEQSFIEPDVDENKLRPGHYNKGIEVIEFTNSHNLNFNRGNVVKYICRAGLKDKAKEIEDLEKAKQYIDFEIERLKDEN